MYILLTGAPGLFRDGVERILREFAQDADVRAFDAWPCAPPDARPPDCVVMDGDAPSSGDLLDAMSTHMRNTPVVVLLAHATRARVDELVAAGVAGCVEKSASAALLFGAMKLALAGGIYLPRALLASSHDDAAKPMPAAHLHLTPRQIEVLALLARGRSNKSIALQLDVSEATVKTHLTAIFKALNVSSRGEASAVAARIEKVRDEQITQAVDGHIALGRLLANMECRRYRAGETLFRRGDPSDEMFYLVQGTVRLTEIGIELGAGSILGEIGLFLPEHRRTSTIVCQTSCELRHVGAADAIRLYYQEPEFALHLIRLLAGRLEADKSRRA